MLVSGIFVLFLIPEINSVSPVGTSCEVYLDVPFEKESHF